MFLGVVNARPPDVLLDSVPFGLDDSPRRELFPATRSLPSRTGIADFLFPSFEKLPSASVFVLSLLVVALDFS